MDLAPRKRYTAFDGSKRIAAGPLSDMALAAKRCLEYHAGGPVLVFDEATGEVIELDTRGTAEEVLARFSTAETDPCPAAALRRRGRPKLGVIPREVTLLPRHWDWLNEQPGGASVTLRKLVEEARRDGGGRERVRLAQERTYRVMSVLGGNEPGYEEALRALYAADRAGFFATTQAWPTDVRDFAWRLAEPAFRDA